MSLVEVTAPDQEPITLADAKAFARVKDATDDEVIAGLIATARRHAEGATRRAFVTQTWDLVLNRFPPGRFPIEIPKPPLQSVVSVTYVDTLGAAQIWPAAEYEVDAARELGILRPVEGVQYPNTKRQLNAVTVQFVAGFGDPPDVPATIRTAIKMLTAHWYDNRGPVATGMMVSPVPMTVDDLLNSEAVIRF